MPLTIPRREREWLSWTISSATPSSSKSARRKVSVKKPRSSACTAGWISAASSILVGSRSKGIGGDLSGGGCDRSARTVSAEDDLADRPAAGEIRDRAAGGAALL